MARHLPKEATVAGLVTWCDVAQARLPQGDSIVFEAALSDCVACRTGRSAGFLPLCRGSNHVVADASAGTCQCGDRVVTGARVVVRL